MVDVGELLTASKKRKLGLSLCSECRPRFLREDSEMYRAQGHDCFYKKKSPRAERTGVKHAPSWCKPAFRQGRIVTKKRNRAGKGRRKHKGKKE